jgi:hypothetical protein
VRKQYVDPRKTDLRERTADALDAAGYDVELSPEPIEIPSEAGIRGRIVPDLASVDGSGHRAVYCIRPSATKPLPQWLANWARASLAIGGFDFWVVIEETPSADLSRSSEAAGAGLLVLRIEGMEVIHEAGRVPAEVLDEECKRRVAELRRRLDNKLELHLDAIENDFHEARGVTEPFPDDLQDEYMDGIEANAMKWRLWGEEISELLDGALVECNSDDLDAIASLLERGP